MRVASAGSAASWCAGVDGAHAVRRRPPGRRLRRPAPARTAGRRAASRGAAVGEATGVPGRPGWWVERDNPAEGVDSWQVGAVPEPTSSPPCCSAPGRCAGSGPAPARPRVRSRADDAGGHRGLGRREVPLQLGDRRGLVAEPISLSSRRWSATWSLALRRTRSTEASPRRRSAVRECALASSRGLPSSATRELWNSRWAWVASASSSRRPGVGGQGRGTGCEVRAGDAGPHAGALEHQPGPEDLLDVGVGQLGDDDTAVRVAGDQALGASSWSASRTVDRATSKASARLTSRSGSPGEISPAKSIPRSASATRSVVLDRSIAGTCTMRLDTSGREVRTLRLSDNNCPTIRPDRDRTPSHVVPFARCPGVAAT